MMDPPFTICLGFLPPAPHISSPPLKKESPLSNQGSRRSSSAPSLSSGTHLSIDRTKSRNRVFSSPSSTVSAPSSDVASGGGTRTPPALFHWPGRRLDFTLFSGTTNEDVAKDEGRKEWEDRKVEKPVQLRRERWIEPFSSKTC